MVKWRTHLEKLTVPVYGVEDLSISKNSLVYWKNRIAKLSFNKNPYGVPPEQFTQL